MTDQEALLELLKRFDLVPHPGEPGDDNYVMLAAKYGNVSGYTGFIAAFEFDKNGKFVELGLWE